MFAEILLGRMLGKNPGDDGKGSWARGQSPHAETDIPYARINELRRLCRWTDALLEAVRNGAVSRRSLLLLVERWEAGERPEPTVDDLEIRAGDFRAVLGDIEPGTVALVLTDPPYPERYLPLWADLGAWAADALAPGGSLVAYCGQAI